MFRKLYTLWVLILIFLFVIITGFDKCSGNPPPNNTTNNKPIKECDSLKPTGKILDSKNIKSVDSLKRETTRNLNAIHRYGAGSFIVGGDSGIIMITPNGGLNWFIPSSGTTKNLYGCAINDYDTMMAVGDSGKILRSNNKGVTWGNVSSGTTKTLRSVSFPTKLIGFSSGDDGIVIKTKDAGISWKIIYSDTLAGIIKSIYFADSVTGWFCTSKGMIYKSINGGISWNVQYSNSAVSLNCISFNGSSKGTAVGSGGAIVETNNGGGTWNLSAFNPGVKLNGVHRVNDKLAFICGDGKIIRESNNTMTQILNNPAYKFNAVDPDPYIMGLTVADAGLIAGVTVVECDCTNKSDLVLFPTEDNNKWRISIRLNYNSGFREYLRIIVPGYELDNSVLTGWTQSDQIQSNNPSINYTLSSSGGSQTTTPGNYTVTGINDVITINLNSRNSAFINLELISTGLNNTSVGSVNFFYGTPDDTYCASVKYILSN